MKKKQEKVTVSVELTPSQLENMIEFIEIEFINSLRRDEEIDNIDYVIDFSDALRALRNARSDYDVTSCDIHGAYKA